MYTSEQLAEMPTKHLVNIITSLCENDVPEYKREVKQCKAELARRGERIRFVKAPSRYEPGEYRRVAKLVKRR